MLKRREFEDASRGRVYVLEAPLRFTVKGLALDVPEGFESDGCSCPRWLWPLFSPAREARYLEAAICHDYLYATHAVSRKDADKWYRDALREAGCTAATAYAGYLALRLCGGSHWDNSTEI